MSDRSGDGDHRVTPLELFFDLVFAFGFTQVTTLLRDDPTWGGLAYAVLALALLWWGWAAYAWLTNIVDTEAGLVIATMLVATSAMFLTALAVPDAFTRQRVLFAVAFLIVLVLFVTLYALAVDSEPGFLAVVRRAASWNGIGAALLLGAIFVPAAARPALWLAAVAAGMAGPVVGGMLGWRVQPAHFAERHGLIVVIAIGESLVGIGVGARSSHLGVGIIAAVLLGLAVAAAFWLAYFGFYSAGLQQLLTARRGAQRAAMARDAYSYLHLPMVAGVVLFGYAMGATLRHLYSDLRPVPAFALCIGSGLYLLAHVGLAWRLTHTLDRSRIAASLGLAMLYPVALVVPALAALALVAAVWFAMGTYELPRFRHHAPSGSPTPTPRPSGYRGEPGRESPAFRWSR